MVDIILNPWLCVAFLFGLILYGLYIMFFKREENAENGVDSEETSSVENELKRIREELVKQQQQINRFRNEITTLSSQQPPSWGVWLDQIEKEYMEE